MSQFVGTLIADDGKEIEVSGDWSKVSVRPPIQGWTGTIHQPANLMCLGAYTLRIGEQNLNIVFNTRGAQFKGSGPWPS